MRPFRVVYCRLPHNYGCCICNKLHPSVENRWKTRISLLPPSNSNILCSPKDILPFCPAGESRSGGNNSQFVDIRNPPACGPRVPTVKSVENPKGSPETTQFRGDLRNRCKSRGSPKVDSAPPRGVGPPRQGPRGGEEPCCRREKGERGRQNV